MQQLNILLIEAGSSDGLLEKILNKHSYVIIKQAFEIDAIDSILASSHPDITIFKTQSPNGKMLEYIRKINQSYSVPVVIFAEDQKTETINSVIQAGVSAYVVDGLETKRVKAIIAVAMARFKEQQQLKRELEQTKQKLEDRILLDRAKAILIKTQGFSEDTAYHTLRKLAMERSISIAEVAKNVISMADLLTEKVG